MSATNSTNNPKTNLTVVQQGAKAAGFLGSGWSYPPTFTVGNFQLNMALKRDNINQSIDVILQTRHGERSLNPGFGSSLHSFFFVRIMLHCKVRGLKRLPLP
jgi:hypothetical protein